MINNKYKIIIKEIVSPIIEINNRFLFVKDSILRENLSITSQYTFFLLFILDKLDASETTVASSIHKDIIVQTGTILESCLHYCLKVYIESGIIKSSDVMPADWETRDNKTLYKISEDEIVCGAIQYKKTEKLTNQTNFIIVNRAAKKAGILNETLFDKAEEIRQLRNKIHLVGLRDKDDIYTSKTSQKIFDMATEIIKIIEEKLTELV